ncbi:hypothetical protein IWW35_003543, partial [Coemansia sp. RSA 1878]
CSADAPCTHACKSLAAFCRPRCLSPIARVFVAHDICSVDASAYKCSPAETAAAATAAPALWRANVSPPRPPTNACSPPDAHNTIGERQSGSGTAPSRSSSAYCPPPAHWCSSGCIQAASSGYGCHVL